jgi:hypothetical protein
MKKFLLFLSALLIYTPAQAYIMDGRAIKNEALMTYIKENMNNKGTLKLNKSGQLYIELEQGYISKLQSKIDNKGFLPLKSNNDHTLKITPPAGSILTDQLTLIPQINKTVEFKPISLYLLAEDDQEFYMLSVHIPELKAPNNTFAIKIAVQKISNFDELAN